jgi:hypothetical protein
MEERVVEYVGVPEAARRARRTAETVRRWIWAGRLPARKQRGRLLVALSDLDALIGAGRAPALSEVLAEVAAWRASLDLSPAVTAADLVIAERRDRWGSASDAGL